MTELNELRARLDEVDERMLAAITARFDVIREIAKHKAVAGIAMMQPTRVSYVRQRYADHAKSLGVAPERLAAIAGELIAAACQLEDELMDDERLRATEHTE
ncbi:chorismate mutase [Amycolatopsis sp. NBC_00345]|uniref:chorismate mutase n=1 Tax=Amycolatopsis sp. NBC_00345 TaxID=2975955 RepID=UPI002E2637C1